FDLFKTIQTSRCNNIDVKLGLVVDYIPGDNAKITEIMRNNEYDYIISSVHYIDGWAFDHPDFKSGFNERDIDEIYSQYTGILMKMIQYPCFDVVGHIDLVKKWGHLPRKHKTMFYFEPVLKAIQAKGLTVEINSAGLRKDVAEIYPAADLLNMMFAYNIPIIFGSDAHHPDQMGEGLSHAYRLAGRAGYRSFVRFSQRQKLVTPIDF
ncbi:MAG: histidinol-phosphatase HisJ family protein, partial [Syntrophomonas sp.]|nr:histidinol-phosphatase HisJ family protein [Syntrophomonas sp.]